MSFALVLGFTGVVDLNCGIIFVLQDFLKNKSMKIILLGILGSVISAAIGTFWYSMKTPMGKIHLESTGFSKFSKEEQDGFTWTSITLAFAAAQVRHSKDGSKMPLKDYTENVTKDVKRTADEYVKRMQRNYARSGNAVTDDQLIIGDGETCKAIAEEVGRNAR